MVICYQQVINGYQWLSKVISQLSMVINGYWLSMFISQLSMAINSYQGLLMVINGY